ncbi:MAG TPA: type II secretion system protein [Luteolibacter sp.]|nr:type II secretion system protein [Luteolibacter sp.]
MKTPRNSRRASGFTLIELMVAMTITTLIVTILVSITAIALDTWTRSRAEVRAARQSKSMIDTMARDLEALVNRRGTNIEWLSAITIPLESKAESPSLDSPNTSSLIFYTSPTDRYDGDVSEDAQVIGDVSCVGYQLKYQDPIQAKGSKEIPTFVLYRNLVNPDKTYDSLLSKANRSATSLRSMFDDAFGSDMDKQENFVCENIFQFTITANVTVGKNTATPIVVPITLGGEGASATEFRLEAGNIITDYTGSGDVSSEDIKLGNLSSIEVSVTVLSDFGVEQMRKRSFKTPAEKETFLAKYTFQYSKLVQVATP